MVSSEDLFQPFVRYVGVNLSRSDVAVPQHHLYGPQIGAVLKQVGCKAMPQQVRRYVADPCLIAVADDQLPKRLPAQARARRSHKQERTSLSGKQAPAA